MDEPGTSNSYDDGTEEICLNLYDHLIKNSNPERFSCPGCGQELAKRNWILHAKTNFSCQSNPAKRGIKCPGCFRKFVLRERMVEHYSLNHGTSEIEVEILDSPEAVQEFLDKLHKEGGVMFSSRSSKKGVHHYKCKLEDRLRFDRDPPNEKGLFNAERKVETCIAFAISTPLSDGTYHLRYCNNHSHDVITPTKTKKVTILEKRTQNSSTEKRPQGFGSYTEKKMEAVALLTSTFRVNDVKPLPQTTQFSEFCRTRTKRKHATSDFINAEDLLPKDDSWSIIKEPPREYLERLGTRMQIVQAGRLHKNVLEVKKFISGTTEYIEHPEHDCFVWHDYERSTTERRMKYIYKAIAAKEVRVKEELIDSYTKIPEPLVKIEPELFDEDVKPCI